MGEKGKVTEVRRKIQEFTSTDARERNIDPWKILFEGRWNSVRNKEREDIFIIYLLYSGQSWPCSATPWVL